MKIWHGYASEHSMNLVMIGRFKEAGKAIRVKEFLDQISARVGEDVAERLIEFDGTTDRFSDKMLDFLRAANLYSLGPADLEQFGYDVSVKVDCETLVIRTDESDIGIPESVTRSRCSR